jgi:nicotinate-nucleotide pyrophosphorylase
MSEDADLRLVRLALAEDLAGYGDITSELTVPADLMGRAVITARTDMVVCGLELARAVMQEVDSRASFTCVVEDGAEATDRDELAVVEGPARGILTAERTMLNLLSHSRRPLQAQARWWSTLGRPSRGSGCGRNVRWPWGAATTTVSACSTWYW